MDKDTKKNILEIFLGYLTNTSPKLLFLHLLWLIIASCTLSTSYIMTFHFTSVLNVWKQAHDIENFSNNLKLSAAQDVEINYNLQTLLETTKSNRAYVFRYHNGLAAINGVPFFFQSLTHEVISPGTPRVIKFEQHLPASINIAMNNQFMMNKCGVVEHADDDRDSQNYWFFQIRAAKSVIRCPIFMANGDLFGFVGIDYLTDIQTGQLPDSLEKTKASAQKLASLFGSKK